jgi:sugar O-acyltransferase (sialic acid O-acetyltransferase NeuD family)
MGSEKPPAVDLAVYGAGGMGQEIVDLALSLGGDWRVVGIVDDSPGLSGATVLGVPVVGGRDWLGGRSVSLALGVGSPAARRRLWSELSGVGGLDTPALIHPAAHVGLGCSVGPGCVVAAGAVLTADVRLGRCVIVNAGATVSHNSRLADFATVAPGAHLAGNTTVGEGADIGIGASFVQGLTVGAWSVVGAGAVVIDDVADNTTVVGCPARAINTREAGWHL